jgi:hypothetical protein
VVISRKIMNAKELMNPRFEIIADYPESFSKVGDVIECPNFEHDFTKMFWIGRNEKYPHLFRKMNWWEKRKANEMPKKVMSLADDKKDVYEIQEWDMDILVGWIDKKTRECCSLETFKPEFGYVPVD